MVSQGFDEVVEGHDLLQAPFCRHPLIVLVFDHRNNPETHTNKGFRATPSSRSTLSPASLSPHAAHRSRQPAAAPNRHRPAHSPHSETYGRTTRSRPSSTIPSWRCKHDPTSILQDLGATDCLARGARGSPDVCRRLPLRVEESCGLVNRQPEQKWHARRNAEDIGACGQ